VGVPEEIFDVPWLAPGEDLTARARALLDPAVCRKQVLHDVRQAVATGASEGGIRYDPEYWCHRDDCGTTCCTAGFAALAAGFTPTHGSMTLSPDGEYAASYQSVATALLDLNPADAGWLFDIERSPRQVLAALEILAEGYVSPDCGPWYPRLAQETLQRLYGSRETHRGTVVATRDAVALEH
jgi:hypothetical protein